MKIHKKNIHYKNELPYESVYYIFSIFVKLCKVLRVETS